MSSICRISPSAARKAIDSGMRVFFIQKLILRSAA